MTEDMLGIVMLIIFLIGCGVVMWKYLETRHQQRMAMIEKGNDVFHGAEKIARRTPGDPLVMLKWGMLAGFIGIGLFVGQHLRHAWGLDETALISSMLVAGGIALALYYLIAASKGTKNAE